MESRTKLFGHPVHPMLIVFPLGLLASSLLFDILFLIFGRGELAATSYRMIAVGVVTGVIAAVFGFIDWLAIPKDTRAKRIGALHGGGNVVVLLLFVVSFLLRGNTVYAPPNSALVFSVIGVLLALVTAWLGGELVDRLGVGVDEGANLDAPSSLTDRPIHGHA